VEYPIEGREPKAIPYIMYPRRGMIVDTNIPFLARTNLTSLLFTPRLIIFVCELKLKISIMALG